jgi:exopolysaccharide production protein ExoQ
MTLMIYTSFVLYMLLPTEALSYLDRMIYGEWEGKPGDKLTEILNLLAIAVSLLLFWWGNRRVWRPRLNRALPLAAAGLLLTSVLWSVAPTMTMTRSVAYFFLIIGAIGVVEIFDSNQVMRLTALIGGISAAISLIVPDPAYAITGDLQGLFPQKNVLGQAMAIGVLAGLHSLRVAGRWRLLYIGITVLCTIVAFLSKSATSLLTIFAFFLVHVIGTLHIRGGIARIISLCLAIFSASAFVLVITNVDLIFGFLDKDPTLTGRTDFWPYIIDDIYQRPLLGWGFAAFFVGSNPAAAAIFSAVSWGFNEAHNGLLQLLLDVGVVGTALFLFLWMRNFIMAVKCINGPAPALGISSLALLVGILLIGATEQVLTTTDGLTLQFFVLGFMCEKQLWFARRARSIIDLRAAMPHREQFAGSQEGDLI